MSAIGLITQSVLVSLFWPGWSAGLGMGIATSKAVEAVTASQKHKGKINSVLLLGLVLAESTAIYGFCSCAVDHVCVRRWGITLMLSEPLIKERDYL